MKEHLPEIFASDVEKLGDAQGPVEAELHHEVPPDVPVNHVVGIIVPAVFDVPQPGFGPQDHDSIKEDGCVVKTSPP
jgi:hypothetical protein